MKDNDYCIFCIVGKSGTGKTAITQQLAQKYDWEIVWSVTTRPKRTQNETGHLFRTDDEFDEIMEGHCVAYSEICGYRYGVSKEQIDRNDFFVVDPDGLQSLKENYHGEKQIIAIGLKDTLIHRIQHMRKRGDSWRSILKRIIHDAKAFRHQDEMVDLHLYSDCLDATVDLINSVCSLKVEEENDKKWLEKRIGVTWTEQTPSDVKNWVDTLEAERSK